MGRHRRIVSTAEETIRLGEEMGKTLGPDSILCFFGDLAAGKTTLIKGIVAGVTGHSTDEVCSPTFVYLNIYEGPIPVYHFDLYRLHGPDDFLSAGFAEYLTAGGICCIEWSERIEQILPPNRINIHLSHEGMNRRKIVCDDEAFALLQC